MCNLPAGFEQIELFAQAPPKPEPKKAPSKKKKETIYRCKCGNAVGTPIQPRSVFCLNCGKMKEEE